MKINSTVPKILIGAGLLVIPFLLLVPTTIAIKPNLDYKIYVHPEIHIKFDSIADSKVQGVTTTNTPKSQVRPVAQPGPNPSPTPVTPPPTNTAPKMYIKTPLANSSYDASTYDAKSGKYYTSVSFSGWGTDAEDGNIDPSKMNWYYNTSSTRLTYLQKPVLMGTGSSIRYTFYANYCTNTTYTITLKGTDSGNPDGKILTGTNSISITIKGYCPVIY